MDAKQLFGEEFVPLTPLHFFSLHHEIPKLPQKHKGSLGDRAFLPDVSGLSDEKKEAEVSLAWSEEGMLVELKVEGDFDHPVYPQLEDGDSFELFIDTRDLKTAGFNHRFCHHFYLFPSKIEGAPQAGEITRFRTEDSHDHCDPEELQVVALKKGCWQLWIPKNCLVGYDPQQFDRVGIGYRLNRWAKRGRQHFAVHSREYAVDQQPGLWSSMRLVQ